MSVAIRLLELINGEPHEASGRWLVRYDPEFHLPSGRYDGGDLETTTDRKQATRYRSVAEAVGVYRSGPTCPCHRLRADGRPNRPLTAFSALFERDLA